ncbi:MAG: hypothetical protein LBN26_08985 [Christensenellaceae bacterium]|jgi:exopolyphosphatase/guanosine-5'-triphosphate,3'-diphosphate pyrophosphatase|nr:hypothetical protein [Christensenellaceae bacterium]
MKQAAVLDIGSNSIRYACGGVSDAGRFTLEPKRLATTKLAEGLTQTGLLGQAPIARTLEAIRGFAADATARGLPVFAYATSAVRDSANREELLSPVRALGIAVEVLPGADEARYAMLGATGGKAGLIDIGGGSTQVLQGGFSASWPIGCVRAGEYAQGAPTLAALRERVYAACAVSLMRFPAPGGEYVGVGGTITTLAALELGLRAYAPGRICEVTLSPTMLAARIESLYEMGAQARRAHPLLKDRYDTILPGACILEYVLKQARIALLPVSDRDGMEGYLMAKLGVI